MKRLLPHAFALAVAGLILILVLGLSEMVGLIAWLPTTLAALVCGLAAAAFAYLASSGSWIWGLLVSSACWLFLGFTFVSLWNLDSFSWWPVIDAVIVAAVACAGGSVGRRLASRGPVT